MRKWFLGGLLAFFFCISTGVVLAAGPFFPEPNSYLVDQAQLLSADQAVSLERELNDFKASTTHEIAVVTMPDLGGLTPADYAQQLWVKWGIGVAGRDNGVLLLVAVKEDRIRIQTGRGVEDVLPDVLAGRIIRDQIRPSYNQGERGLGIVLGTHAIMEALLTAPAADIPYVPESSAAKESFFSFIDPGLLVAVGMFLFFIGLWVLLSWLDRKSGRKSSSWDDWGSGSSWGGGSSSSSSSSDSSSSSSSSDSSSSGSSFGGYGGGSSGGGGAEG